jgi:glycosyltransferase involved in cell wall biosynthesis
MLFHELDQSEPFANRISLSASQYLSRIDHFVSKYEAGAIPNHYGVATANTTVIPNGVPHYRAPVTEGVRVRPPAADASLAVVTCCRIVPNKQLESMLEVASELGRRVPGATLTIVGGVDPRHLPYWSKIMQRYRELELQGIVHFAGPNADVFSFLHEFRVFAMLSWSQGCPNASLEAMAAGLPVVANDDGGTREQVEDGRTGFLVSGNCLAEMAERIATLLRNPCMAERLGRAGQEKARLEFSMRRMMRRYAEILWPAIKSSVDPDTNPQEMEAARLYV